MDPKICGKVWRTSAWKHPSIAQLSTCGQSCSWPLSAFQKMHPFGNPETTENKYLQTGERKV